jgi:sec-independent protein translocase protein TatA
MFGIHPLWLVLVLVLVLIIFGPSRLPELGNALGRSIREFRKAGEDIKEEVSKATAPATAKPDQPAGGADIKVEQPSTAGATDSNATQA